uniref:Gag-Pol polyprotein n=1 Tax=Tanacetum cinerariifolium TaxID=118510 RepID=A0A6L2JUK4_TANCI|nr:Gag-Pol polyprotein [Tanacetum cinerariifolium]
MTFLNDPLKEEVDVAQPDGFVDPDHPKKVYRLRKALYGLKKAPRAWYDELSKFLTSKGFTKEAEYVALSASCAQVMWMRTRLQDYGFNYNKIPSYCDSQSAIAIFCNLVQHSRTNTSILALLEDTFKYLVRRIGMRCLTPAELEVVRLGFSPMIQPEPEGSTQGHSILENAVLSEDGNPALANIKQDLGRSYALSWKPCQGDSLNLPNNRIRDGVAASFQLESESSPHAHAQTTKTY